jgi:arabinose-5-phosphate isomerase
MRMADAIVVMTEKSLGCVIVTESDGRLAGIITDGDLRRRMSPNLLDQTVEAIMTRAPKTIGPGQLVSLALDILNSSNTTQLIVVEHARPVGIVHFHDLLRAGVA